MAKLTIEVHDNDMDTLAALAKRKWREPDAQASSLIEDAMAAERARASGIQRGPGRRAGERVSSAPRNGVHTAPALTPAG